ncbi:hypothetical protein BH10PSE2_BH10PSE2_30220 [soil metagenome]
MREFRKILRLGVLVAATGGCLALGGCAGVLDWCGKGLNAPAGGWDRHGPG